MSAVIVLSALAVAAIVGIVALLYGAYVLLRRAFWRISDEDCEDRCCSDFDPTFKPRTKFNGQKDTPR